MKFKKLSASQKNILAWRRRRNHLVCKLLEADKYLSREAALQKANAILGKRRG